MSLKEEFRLVLRDEMSKGLKGIDSRMGSLDDKVSNYNKGLKQTSSSIGGVGAMASKAIPLLGAAFAISRITAFGNELKDLTAEFESYTNAIEASSQGSTDFHKNMSFIKRISGDLGSDLRSTTQGFKSFNGALIGTTLQGEKGRDIFEKVTRASTVMGLSADQQKGAFLALGQIMSKGKVQAEELRGQLGERIPGAFGIAARAMGVTTKELDKLMSDGLLTANDFLPKFANELEKTFGGKVAKASKSLRSEINRNNNAWLELKLTLGKKLQPTFKHIIGSFGSIAKGLKGIIGTQKDYSNGLREQVTSLQKNKQEINDYIGALTNSNISEEKRIEIINTLNSKYPDLIGNKITEKSTEEEILAVKKELNESLRESIALKIKEATQTELLTKQAEKQISLQKALIEKSLIEIQSASLTGSAISKDKFQELRSNAVGLGATSSEIEEAIKDVELDNIFENSLGNSRIFNSRKINSLKDEIDGLNKEILSSDALISKTFNLDSVNKKSTVKGGGTTSGGTSSSTIGGISNSSIQGQRPKQVTINIDRQIGELTFKTTNMQESENDIKESVRRVMAEALNDTVLGI